MPYIPYHIYISYAMSGFCLLPGFWVLVLALHSPRHPNWAFSGQLIFGQFPRKVVPGTWDAHTAKETENRQGEVGFLRYSP
jgi:hypothetical protein